MKIYKANIFLLEKLLDSEPSVVNHKKYSNHSFLNDNLQQLVNDRLSPSYNSSSLVFTGSVSQGANLVHTDTIKRRNIVSVGVEYFVIPWEIGEIDGNMLKEKTRPEILSFPSQSELLSYLLGSKNYPYKIINRIFSKIRSLIR